MLYAFISAFPGGKEWAALDGQPFSTGKGVYEAKVAPLLPALPPHADPFRLAICTRRRSASGRFVPDEIIDAVNRDSWEHGRLTVSERRDALRRARARADADTRGAFTPDASYIIKVTPHETRLTCQVWQDDDETPGGEFPVNPPQLWRWRIDGGDWVTRNDGTQPQDDVTLGSDVYTFAGLEPLSEHIVEAENETAESGTLFALAQTSGVYPPGAIFADAGERCKVPNPTPGTLDGYIDTERYIVSLFLPPGETWEKDGGRVVAALLTHDTQPDTLPEYPLRYLPLSAAGPLRLWAAGDYEIYTAAPDGSTGYITAPTATGPVFDGLGSGYQAVGRALFAWRYGDPGAIWNGNGDGTATDTRTRPPSREVCRGRFLYRTEDGGTFLGQQSDAYTIQPGICKGPDRNEEEEERERDRESQQRVVNGLLSLSTAALYGVVLNIRYRGDLSAHILTDNGYGVRADYGFGLTEGFTLRLGDLDLSLAANVVSVSGVGAAAAKSLQEIRAGGAAVESVEAAAAAAREGNVGASSGLTWEGQIQAQQQAQQSGQSIVLGRQ